MSNLSIRHDSPLLNATEQATNITHSGATRREASAKDAPTLDARLTGLSRRPTSPSRSESHARKLPPLATKQVEPRAALDKSTLSELAAKYVPLTSREPRGLNMCVRMLRKVSARANPAIAKLQNDLFLLTTIVGKKQGPFRFERADYMKCCEDAGVGLTQTLGLRAQEFFGNTPLINALFNDNEDLSVALILHHLSNGVSLDNEDGLGKTPLMISAIKGHRDAFDLLLNHGANPSLCDKAGNNVLHMICMRGDVEAYRALKLSMPSDAFAALLDHPNAEGRKPAELLRPMLEHELFDQVSIDERGLERFGRFDRDYSIWVGRPAIATCDMDTNVGRDADPRTLREVLVANRRQLTELMATE